MALPTGEEAIFATYSRTARLPMHAIADGSCPVMPLMMLDRLEPMMTSLDFVITYQVLIRELDIYHFSLLKGPISDLTLGGHEGPDPPSRVVC